MSRAKLFAAATFASLGLATNAFAAPARPVYADPIDLPTARGVMKAEEGYIAVPENRADPKSRTILINYLRIFARSPAKRDPVFELPGGPGDLLDRRDFAKTRYPHPELNAMLWRQSANRDVVVVNQRGNYWLIDNFAAFEAPPPPKAPGPPPSPTEEAKAWKTSIKATLDRLRAGGVDLTGYDIVNSVEDVEDARVALGYDHIILHGFSYGSQWSLAYIRTHPEHVSRAILAGVEPIDYGYDSSDTLWASLKRTAAAAEASPIAGQLPSGGLVKAVLTIEDRLRKVPVTVEVVDPASKAPTKVTVTLEDFQAVLLHGWHGRRLRDQQVMWPKFVTEVYNGDYRYVALRKLDGLFPFNGNINMPLIDLSMGISPAHDAELLKEKGNQVLGDTNFYYRIWKDVIPTHEVSDDYRLGHKSDVPTMIVQGDMDLQTPMENALYQAKYLTNGHVTIVHTGTHVVFYEIIDDAPQLSEKVAEFTDLDLQPNPDPKAFLAGLPNEVSIPLAFEPPNSKSLYDRMEATDR